MTFTERFFSGALKKDKEQINDGSPLKRIRVCFVLPNHYSFSNGGSEYQVKLLIQKMRSVGGLEIYYLCRDVPFTQEIDGHVLRKVGDGKGISRYGYFFDFRRILKDLSAIDPHVIYQRVGCAYTGIAAYYRASRKRGKLLWHIASDSDIDPQPLNSTAMKIRWIVERACLNYGIRHADIIIGQTRHQDTALRARFGRGCDVIVPNGHPCPVDPEKKSDRISVLWISNMKPLKQPEIFLKLVRRLSGMKKISFVMLGRPGAGVWFEKLKKDMDEMPHLEYTGEVSNDEVNRRLSAGHILVNTSQYEGFPNTFIQAWLSRVPVVSLQVDPDDILVREMIGFHSKSFEQLCLDIMRLLESETLRTEMGARARLYAVERHSVEKMTESIIKLF